MPLPEADVTATAPRDAQGMSVPTFAMSHLDRVLRTYVEQYTQERQHRGLRLLAPESAAPAEKVGVALHIHRQDLLDGLMHEYECTA